MPSGPPPKDPAKRARTNAEPVAIRVLPRIVASQPDLPAFQITKTYQSEDGPVEVTVDYDWSPRTLEWWEMWAGSALAVDFTATDWSELLDTAFIHSEFWKGGIKWAGELRLRTAKFGATPEDRLRLRIQFAQAVDAELTTGAKIARTPTDRFAEVGARSAEPDVAS